MKGVCFCGKVEYELEGNLGIFQYCHCSRCRKFTGSAFASNMFVGPQQFSWVKGEEYVRQFNPEDTKYFATAFCTNCGSSLPWKSKSGQVVVVPAGGLEDDPVIRPSQNIFCASSAPWFVDPNELPKHDAMPLRKT